MISKTSLFNKGIYKSTVRRYAWGGILYFIMLFIFTGMLILLNENPEYVNEYWSDRGFSTLLRNEYVVIPMIMSIVVPCVAGLLIFRYIHSKKTSVFVHSLPVKRSANYISSVLAALTLMAVPIVLNTVILMIMSVAAYSLHFTIGNCITWMLLNLFSVFVMFSCVCLVATITGNSFAMLGLNILLHTVGLILAAAFTMVCEVFLYGFAGEGVLVDSVFNNIFITRVPSIVTGWGYASDKVIKGYIVDIAVFMAVAIVLYVVSGILYNKRRMETCEDVAGFTCLNHIFKYLVTFIGAIATFAIFCFSIHDSSLALWLIVLVVSGVIYFGTEMLLKKTLRVWNSYKGYVGFLTAFAAMMCLFAFTAFFGFETYVPESAEVKSVAVYDYYRNKKPDISGEEMVNRAIRIHKEMLAGKKTVAEREYNTRIHIEYTLESGRTIHRVYPVNEQQLYKIMDSLYENKAYKEKREEILTPMETVYKAALHNEGEITAHIAEAKQLEELVECIRKDTENLSYSQINSDSWSFGIELNYVPVESKTINLDGIEVTENSVVATSEEDIRIEYMYQAINANYTNTINWIYQNGYWDAVALKNEGVMYIARDWQRLPFIDSEGRTVDHIIEGKDDFLKIDSEEERQKIIDFAHNTLPEYISENEKFRIFRVVNEQSKSYDVITTLTKEQIANLFPEKDWQKLD